MQADCNLVLYTDGRARWATNTAGKGPNCYALIDAGGNLIVYNRLGHAVWDLRGTSHDGVWRKMIEPGTHISLNESSHGYVTASVRTPDNVDSILDMYEGY
jgi:hypothetical protein